MRDLFYSMCVGAIWSAVVLLPVMVLYGATARAAISVVVLLMVLCVLTSLVLHRSSPGEG